MFITTTAIILLFNVLLLYRRGESPGPAQRTAARLACMMLGAPPAPSLLRSLSRFFLPPSGPEAAPASTGPSGPAAPGSSPGPSDSLSCFPSLGSTTEHEPLGLALRRDARPWRSTGSAPRLTRTESRLRTYICVYIYIYIYIVVYSCI